MAGLPPIFVTSNKKPYKSQAKLFLNAFWPTIQKDAEEVWTFTHLFFEFDEKKDKGCDLDEFNAHRYLEKLGETMRVVELRNALREADLNFDRRLSCLEFLLWRYKKTIADFAKANPEDHDAPENITEEMKKANAALDAVRSEINKIESKKEELREKSAGSGVKAMQAKNELHQLLNSDPTELNKALLTAEAACRKAGGLINAPPGSLWWMNRELEEMKKYRPQRKQ